MGHRITRSHHALGEDTSIQTTPARIFFLRDPAEILVQKPPPIVHAGRGIADEFQAHGTDAHPITGLHRRPVDARERHILSGRAGRNRMALSLESLDDLEREDADCAVGASMNIGIALTIAFHASFRYRGLGHSEFRHTAIRHAELMDTRKPVQRQHSHLGAS
jgi:hypothetical protein